MRLELFQSRCFRRLMLRRAGWHGGSPPPTLLGTGHECPDVNMRQRIRFARGLWLITPEMIKRSGARNIPDVLRMAPGVDVARLNAHTWAISIRGFNDVYAKRLLVQIDGRVVYQAAFGGVYWDMQDVVLADVERI